MQEDSCKLLQCRFSKEMTFIAAEIEGKIHFDHFEGLRYSLN